MAANANIPVPPPQNGVITGPPKGVVGGNRKKQKRRAKQAAKAAVSSDARPTNGRPAGNDYDEDPLGYGDEDDEDYSDAEHYDHHYADTAPVGNGYDPQEPTTSKKKKKKASSNAAHHHSPYNPALVSNNLPHLPTPPPPSLGALAANHSRGSHDDIWNTSTQQERQNIKEFWLSLSEEDRKSLLKIEKEAVLRKMKQQQKHSCSCTVCGRKRTAIEEELEVLYEGYYEELEQYAHHDQPPNLAAGGLIPDPLQHRKLPHPLAAPPPNPPHKTSHLHEHLDDEEFSDEDDYSDEEEYSDDALSSPAHMRSAVPDFFTFGQNLTVKDNILTVADDLLKNDGRKFIEMMEQLAERRMQRENEAEYAAANPNHPSGYPPGDPGYIHEDPLAADDYDDDEASYDSQEEYDDDLDDEDEMGGLTEEQRMQEGRRMFQIFAARMFEQRVLTAYKEKVAAERQRKLLEEIDDEGKLEAQREAKKQRDAQKKKDKKKQQQAAKAEEKARKEAEKAAEEARIREAEEKRQEEQRQKREEQRKKKEEEKRKQEEERLRKEADRARRQQEEQQRREEAERKAREQKITEKARKEELRKKEREEREAREKESRERKAQEDREKKERDAKARADRETKDRSKTTGSGSQTSVAQQTQPMSKRPSQAGMVAVPGVTSRSVVSSLTSPHPTIATPALPKAATPTTAQATQPRQTSQQGSLGSSPKLSNSQVSSVPSKSSSPNSAAASHPQPPPPFAGGPPKIMQKPGNQSHGPTAPYPMLATSPPNQSIIQPPPGMAHLAQHSGGYTGMLPMGYSGFQAPPNQSIHGSIGHRSSMPMYPHQGAPLGGGGRFGPPGLNGPSANNGAQPGRMGYPFDTSAPSHLPPGFGQSLPPGPPPQSQQISPLYNQPPSVAPGMDASAMRPGMSTHSRQPSSSEKERFDSTSYQPIARPAPIQRPSSVKPQEESNTDVDDLSKHLGSSALLDDSDEPIPQSLIETRRQSNLAPGARGSVSNMTPLGSFGAPGGFGAPAASWNTTALAFGQSPGLGQPGWGNPTAHAIGGWNNNSKSGFAGTGGVFGSIGGGQLPRPSGAGLSRPLAIRQSVCQACKQLTMASRGEGDGFHDVGILLRQIEANRVPLEYPPTLREVEEICETEGDAQNGGGELHIRRKPGADRASFAVMWQPLAGTPDQVRGIGEIGSPLPGKASPTSGSWGAPGMGRAPGGFPNLGAAVGTSPGSF